MTWRDSAMWSWPQPDAITESDLDEARREAEKHLAIVGAGSSAIQNTRASEHVLLTLDYIAILLSKNAALRAALEQRCDQCASSCSRQWWKECGRVSCEARALLQLPLASSPTPARLAKLEAVAREVRARPIGVEWGSAEFIAWFDRVTSLAFDDDLFPLAALDEAVEG